MSEFLSFAFLQFISYFILVGNIRAVAKLHYGFAALTEVAHLGMLWFILKRIVESDSWFAFAGYVVGGTCGTLLSMYLTRRWKDVGTESSS